MAVEAVGVEGYEADDVIGTLAERAVPAGFDVAIVSIDKDFFQLVHDGLKVYNPRDEGTWYDAAGVKEKFGVLLEGRSMLVKRAQPLPVECVIRGYLTGSGWKDYLKTGATSGHKLPAGLKQCQKLPKPLFTPATKAVTGHDENISFEETVSRIGEGAAKKVEALSLGLYEKGRDYAETKGILIADKAHTVAQIQVDWP